MTQKNPSSDMPVEMRNIVYSDMFSKTWTREEAPIDISQDRTLDYDDELQQVLENTAKWLDEDDHE